MPTPAPRPADEAARTAPYLLFMLVASLLALAVLGIEAFTIDPGALTILSGLDLALCALFFVDFLVSLYRAENKLRYFVTWGWLDLISSIPIVDALRWGRAARVVRILRLLRGVRSAKILTQFMLQRKTQSGAMLAALLVLLLVTFGSITVLHAERPFEQANIRTAEDAVWWSIVTLTTVGYGDKFPVSTEGRVVATILMVAGVGLFGSLSGLVAATFLSPGNVEQDRDVELLRQDVRELRELVQQLHDRQ